MPLAPTGFRDENPYLVQPKLTVELQTKGSVILSSGRAVSLGVLLKLLLVCRHALRGLLIPHLLLFAGQLLPLHRDERAQCRVVDSRALLEQLLPRFLAENLQHRNNSAQGPAHKYRIGPWELSST
jgi:hypothetical protein